MISYDDPTSFGTFAVCNWWDVVLIDLCSASKGKFIVDKQLRGFAMWEAASDHDDLLIDSILTSMGVELDDC